ncbi:MAG TPA: MarR family transcriptional regulator [Chthoniobacterales bacterium]|nr:MarR family transcriptional regulator [Chthoniobacterales bacterium]
MNGDTASEEFGHMLFGTARAWRNKLDQRLRPLGFSQGKWRTLMHLSNGGNKLTQREIAARMGIEEPTLAGLLNRLEEDGWVERRASSNDRRCKVVHLQRRSKKITEQIFAAAHTLRNELIQEVPPRDLETCIRVLNHIRTKAEEQERAKNGAHLAVSRN